MFVFVCHTKIPIHPLLLSALAISNVYKCTLHVFVLSTCTGTLKCMAIRSAAYRYPIASPISTLQLSGMKTMRRQDAATTRPTGALFVLVCSCMSMCIHA